MINMNFEGLGSPKSSPSAYLNMRFSVNKLLQSDSIGFRQLETVQLHQYFLYFYLNFIH